MKVILAASVILLATSAMGQPSQQPQASLPVHVAPFSASLAIPEPESSPTVKRYTFTIASGGTTSLIPIPANRPIKLIAATLSVGQRGMGEASLLAPSPEGFIEWLGYSFDYYQGALALTEGYSAAAGTHMIYADYAGYIDVQVADAAHIQIHNANPAAQKVKVLLIY